MGIRDWFRSAGGAARPGTPDGSQGSPGTLPEDVGHPQRAAWLAAPDRSDAVTAHRWTSPDGVDFLEPDTVEQADRCTTCPEHVDDLRDVLLPIAPWASDLAVPGLRVGRLLDAHLLTTYQFPGEDRWQSSLEEEMVALTEPRAALSLDRSLAAQPGMAAVGWVDGVTLEFHSELCARGVLAALVRAPADPAVRRA